MYKNRKPSNIYILGWFKKTLFQNFAQHIEILGTFYEKKFCEFFQNFWGSSFRCHFQKTDLTPFFHTNSSISGTFHTFSHTTALIRSQKAINRSRQLKQEYQSNFNVSTESLRTFQVRNWSNLGENDENSAYHPKIARQGILLPLFHT